MKTTRPLSRRSFLGRVAGGAIIGGAALTVLGSTAAEAQVTDNDSGAGADQARHGRGNLTDGDSGQNADQAGRGRGPRRTACRNNPSRLTDGDSGQNADAAGCGRGARRR
jgi:hypothetical protein